MLAILPPKHISDQIIGFQKELEVKFGAVHVQKVLPHITVIPPFDCEEQLAKDFIENLKGFLSSFDKKHLIHLDDFQQFDMKTLIVDVAKNVPFERWCKEIKLFFNSQKIIKQRQEKHFFVPHITIANKDIKKRDLKLAWAEFKARKFQETFLLETLTLLKLEDNWREKDAIKL